MLWTISESQFIFQIYSQIVLVPNSANFSGGALRALVPNSIFPNNIFKTQDYLGIPNSYKIFKKLFGTKNYLGK